MASVESSPDIDVVEREIGERDLLPNEWLHACISIGGKHCPTALDIEVPELQGAKAIISLDGFVHFLATKVRSDGIDQPVCLASLSDVLHAGCVDDSAIKRMHISL